MTTMTTTRPFRHDEPQAAYQHWVDITGLDTGTPQWQSVWQALRERDLVGEGGLRMREQDLADPELVPGRSVNSRIVQMALTAAARYPQAVLNPPTPADDEEPRWPAEQTPGADPMDPVLGVEIALTLIFDHLPRFLEPAVEQATNLLLDEMTARVVGVFPDASTALAALIEQTRRDQQPTKKDQKATPPLLQEWPPLVETILTQATKDEIFAEHIFVTTKATGAAHLSYAILPRSHWLILHTGPLSQPSREESAS